MITSISEIVVRYAETDMMGIVYHASYLPWLEIGRTDLLRNLGYPYKKLEEEGLLLPVLEIGMKYKRPAKYDDRIRISTTLREKPIVRIGMDYEIRKEDVLIATATSVHAFMNPQGQAIKAPKEIMSRFAEAFERNAVFETP